MRRVNVEEWLRGEAILYGIEQIVWAIPANKAKNWQEDQIDRLRVAFENWEDCLRTVKASQGGSGNYVSGTNCGKNGVTAHTRLCGGAEISVDWSEIKRHLETAFASEAIGGQITLLDLMGSGFFKEGK